MKNRTCRVLSSPTFVLIVLRMLLLSNASLDTTTGEVEDEREFDYGKGGGKGPSRWGDLKEEWAACKTGRMQSPIDLSSRVVKVVQLMDIVRMNYGPANATIKNRGHDIMIEWELGEAGSIRINETDYFLQQCHWHSPSEHAIDGESYAMEMHMVHMSTDPNVTNKIVVLGLLYTLGAPDPFISKLMMEHIRNMIDKHEEKEMGFVNPTHIKMPGRDYYRYVGSLTTPPCTEGVTWIINKMKMTVSRDQVELLRDAVHDFADNNARPLQPLNNREIYLHPPTMAK